MWSKNINLWVALLALLVFACEPLDETFEELDESTSGLTADIEITLTDDDYEDMEDFEGVPSYVYSDYYFADDVEAGALLPAYLNEVYPHLGNGSFASVTFNIIDVPFSGTDVDSLIFYTVSDQDYTDLGHNFGNFDARSEIIEFLEFKYDVEEGTHVVLTFEYYDGSRFPQTQEETDGYYFANGSWNYAFRVTTAYYEKFDRNRFNNFTAADDDNLPGYQDYILSNEFPSAVAGDVKYISYAYYNGSTTLQLVDALIYDGSNWARIEDNVLEPFTLSFSKKEGEWVPDLTIKFRLSAADATFIAEWKGLDTGPGGNFAQFGSFDIRSSSANYWSPEDLLAAFSALLMDKYPNAEIDQKFEITYVIYDGAVKDQSAVLILTADGYIYFEE